MAAEKRGPGASSAPIGPHTTVREAVRLYPGIEAVFEKYGIQGCGGPDGPMEPIGFFARVHEVDPPQLLRELNQFALRAGNTTSLPLVEERPKPERRLYFIGVIAAVTLAVLAGFPLGILAALGAVRDIGLGQRWTPIVQAHGHLQIMGWFGLFIAAIAVHVVPRFKQVDLRYRALVLPSMALLVTGLILRTATQPWAESGGAAALMVASGVLELAGVAGLVAVIAGTLLGAARKNYDWFLLAGSGWLVLAAVANLVILVELASSRQAVIASAKNAPLLDMYIYGFVLLFVLGVSIRILPHFARLRPPRVRLLLPTLLLLNAGLVLTIGAGWIEAYAGGWARPDFVDPVAIYIIAAGVAGFFYAMNLHLRSVPAEHEDGSHGHVKLIRVAYVWLAIAVAIEVWFGTRSLTGGYTPNFLEAGAARHALALGFVTQMIFGVGSRALPTFAGKRLYSTRLMDASFVLINVAALSRIGPALTDLGSMSSRFDHVAGSGALALLAVVLFAYNIFRTVRTREEIRWQNSSKEAVVNKNGDTHEFKISGATVVADVLEKIPGSLELLISYGFKPLADPELRAQVTPHVTLGTACSMHSVDLQALIADLERLRTGGAIGHGSDDRQRLSVLNALRECCDPELGVNIVDLGLVQEIKVSDGAVHVTMTLTMPDCPAATEIVRDAAEQVRSLGYRDVEVQLVNDPPWDPSRMSPAARMALKWE